MGLHLPAKIKTFSPDIREFFGHRTRHISEVLVSRELFAAILEGIQRFGVPPPLVQRG